MVVVDIIKDINRIIDVIKADPTVFDNGATLGLLRSVVFGNPNNRVSESVPMPYAYITTRESIQKSSYPYGITSSNIIPQITVEYKISVISSSKVKTQESEKLLYDLLKNLRSTLTADPTFTDPEDIGSDPIFTRSVLNQVPWEQDTIGQLVTVVDFILMATIGSIGTIQMSTVNDDNAIEIISESPDTEIEGFSPQFDTALIVKGYAPTGSERSKSIAIDHISSITEELRTLKRTRRPFTLTTTDIDGTTTIHNAILSQLTSNIARIDNIKTDLLQFLIIP